MEENYMAQPSDLRVPGNPWLRAEEPSDTAEYAAVLRETIPVTVEYTENDFEGTREITHVWAGSPALDLLPILTRDDLESFLDEQA